ncbi:sialate O-acetylesterase [Paenibacillus sp. GCM10027626]|uniref:sialate O-acetylesterase n=1 Tax=Paenibacillus sp. GCM10027626 TaxID=3273411 RepID=UPI003624E096
MEKQALIITGLEPHRVYQRQADDTANLTFRVVIPEGLQGRLEIRRSGSAWTAVEQGQDGGLEVTLSSVPVGKHTIHARLVAEQAVVLAEGQIGPVFVGDLWILAGQSNMEGCGRLIDVDTPCEGVSCFYLGDRWAMAEEPLCWLAESNDPVHWMGFPEGMEMTEERRGQYIAAARRDRVQGAGLGLSFGKKLLQHTGIPVGLLMTAHGGTSMDQWDAALAGEGGRSLYGAMLRVIHAAGGKVKGCLWYQGESDTVDMPTAEQYYDKTLKWVERLRQDLNDPELPFIYAQISVVMGWPAEEPWNRVQDDQLRLENVLGRAEMVPTIDAVLADVIHPDAGSLRDIGERMAAAALRLVHGAAADSSGPRLQKAVWNETRTELTLQLSGCNGKLRAVDRVFSLTLMQESERLPLTAHLGADGVSIVVKPEQPAPLDVQLWHGRGLNPTVNIRDEKGIPLPVFGPLEV